MPDYSRSGFLYEAIKDAQGTVRAIDFKANALLVTMALVVTNLQHFVAAVEHVRANNPTISSVAGLLSAAVVVTWFGAVTNAFLALRGRVDVGRLFEPNGAKGAFWDAGKGVISADRRVEEIPADEDAAVRELAFEHLKIAYIRRTKTDYTNRAFDLGYITLVILLALWVMSAATP